MRRTSLAVGVGSAFLPNASRSLSGDYYAEEGKYVRLTLGNFNYPGGGFKENTSKSDRLVSGKAIPVVNDLEIQEISKAMNTGVDATDTAYSEAISLLSERTEIFHRWRLQNCNFVDFLQVFHSRQYTLTEAETGHTKKHNDLKSSVPRQKKSAPFRSRGLRKSIATREKRATIKAFPKTTYGPGHLLLAFGQFTLSTDSFFLSTPKPLCWVSEWFII